MKTKLPIGIQVYNLRDLLENTPENFRSVMQQVKDLGYEGVELAGTYGLSPEEIRDTLREVGLVPVSAHVPFDEMEADIEKVVRDYKTIGCKYIAVPYLPEELRPGTEKYAYVLDSIRKFADYSTAHGLPMLYHNHDFEFYKMPDGEYAFDYMYRTIPQEILGVEPDTCWIKVAGEDPAQYLRKYADRCHVIHIKDFYKEGKTARMYKLLGVEEEETAAADDGVFEFRPLGEGMQNWEEILAAAEETAAEWLIVEQDEHNGIGAIEAARRSMEYLKK